MNAAKSLSSLESGVMTKIYKILLSERSLLALTFKLCPELFIMGEREKEQQPA